MLTPTIEAHKTTLVIDVARIRVQAAAAPPPVARRKLPSVAVMISAFPNNIEMRPIFIQNGAEPTYVLTSDAKRATPLSMQIASATTTTRCNCVQLRKMVLPDRGTPATRPQGPAVMRNCESSRAQHGEHVRSDHGHLDGS